MKKFICFSFALMSLISLAHAQRQQANCDTHPEISRERVAQSMQLHFPGKDGAFMVGQKENLFKMKSTEWRCDTIISYDTVGVKERLTMTLDATGNILILLTEQLQTNLWENASRLTFTYDAAGNILTYLQEQWQTNIWVNVYRISYTYDASGNMLTYFGEKWS